MADRTIIVGGGIVGLCAAYFLARRGAAVTLFDDGHVHDSASTGNAGLISLGHPPLPRPGLAGSAMKWMFDPGSPLYIPPRLDLTLGRWLWQFHRACRRPHYRRSMEVLTAHGKAAGTCIAHLIADEAIECGYAPVGQLEVFGTERGLEGGRAAAEQFRVHGYRTTMLTGAELREREPVFASSVAGAVLYEENAFASPGAFIAGMLEAVRRRGADVRTDTAVAALTVRGGRCTGVTTANGDRVEGSTTILAAGIWSTRLAAGAGLRLPMQPAKGYHVELTGGPGLRTAAVLAEVFVACTPMDGRLRLAGTLELSGINDRIVAKRVEMLLVGARRYLDGVDAASTGSPWCGLRPCTADGLPVIGWTKEVESLFVATGHAMMGFTLGPLAGRIASECILDGAPSEDISAFAADRFTPGFQ